ncbi:MAG: pyridoxamine 5'-phosphate oxidase family protein [Actinomycetota bacterium]|nr:pyridoxamine 5'-phosphate oxidase family protein [Actinomycetota bacterium]
MISDKDGLVAALDRAPIAFLTAVNASGQPQASPVWFHRDGEDIIVYNRPTAARLRSIPGNSRVAFNLRGDRRGHAGVSLEGTAVVDESLPPATDLEGYVDKYRSHIAHLGWTPESFAADYSVPMRLTVTRVRAFGLGKWDETKDS